MKRILLVIFTVVIVSSLINWTLCNGCQDVYNAATSCFDNYERRSAILEKIDDRSDKRKLQLMTSMLKSCYKTANAKVGGQKWQVCDLPPYDTKTVVTKACMAKMQDKFYANIERCMSNNGDSGFSLSASSGRSSGRGRANQRGSSDADYTLADFNAQIAATNCEEKLGIDGLEREISLCFSQELERNSRKFPKNTGKGALFSFIAFDKECKTYKDCRVPLENPSNSGTTCSEAICGCYDTIRTNEQLIESFKKCVANEAAWIKVNATESILQLTREKFPFCTPPDEDDICDPEKGVYNDVANTLQDSYGADNKVVKVLKELAGGADVQNVLSPLAGALGIDTGPLAQITKLFGGNRLK